MMALERALRSPKVLFVLLRPGNVGHADCVPYNALALVEGTHEAERDGENRPAALSGLHGACGEAAAIAHAFDVVYNGDLAVAGEHKVAVHAVDAELCVNGALRGGETLGDDGASVHAARARWVPERPCVGKDVLSLSDGTFVWSRLPAYRIDISKLGQLEGVLHGGDGRVVGRWADESRHCARL